VQYGWWGRNQKEEKKEKEKKEMSDGPIMM
jgi:hypothetical protein